MKKALILEPSALAQWHALVKEARVSSAVHLSEDLESYLIFLLMRFINNPEVATSVLALDFLQNIRKTTAENQQILRDVGDKCLLSAGLFPQKASQRVELSYYVDLGQQAYTSVSIAYKNQFAALFSKLSEHFVALMDVLQAMRGLNSETPSLDLLAAEELWNSTQSTQALKTLRQATQGFLIPRDPRESLSKH
jgi:hypothetical protein